tara:strand:- start:33 stop:785 length:753 start_codon:yes stop_codon:yes gene_type:complete
MSYKVGILIPSTTKGLNCKSYKDSYLYKIFLKSFIKTYDKKCGGKGGKDIFYTIYVVVDEDDPIYSKEKESIISFVKLVKNVSIKFISGDIEKGWVTKMWNFAFKTAYDDGCDYFYQCGDDIEFLDKGWVSECITTMVKHLNEGITGPIDWGRDQYNAKHNMTCKFILTQTFVSRKHMEVFGFYFPEEIKNWFCDDWITNIYIKNKKYWPIRKRILNKGGEPRYTPEGRGGQFQMMTTKCAKLVDKFNFF